MQSQLSYSQIEVNGKYKIDNREIIVRDKHIAMISSATDPEFSGTEERIVYYFVDDEYTNRSSPLKLLNIKHSE